MDRAIAAWKAGAWRPARVNRSEVRKAAAGFMLILGFMAGFWLEPRWASIKRHVDVIWIDWTGPDSISIPAYREAKEQRARFLAAPTKSPLVIDLHQWSEDERGTLGDDRRHSPLGVESVSAQARVLLPSNRQIRRRPTGMSASAPTKWQQHNTKT